MTGSSGTSGSRKNIAVSGGVVYGGDIEGSQVSTATAPGSTAVSASIGTQDQLINELRARLTAARRSLEESHDHSRTADCEDAIAAIDSLNVELDRRREDRDAGKLRRRLERLAEKLTPVTDLIAAGSALLDIVIQLKSVV